MIANSLRKIRFGLRRTPLLHSLISHSRINRIGRRVYEAQALRQKEMSVELMGHSLRFSVSSAREISRVDGLYAEEALLERLLSAIQPGDVFFDIGANIGVISLVVAKAKPSVQIHAFEPEPRNAEALRKNVELNGFTDRFHVHELALGSEDGTATLYVDGDVGQGTHSLVDAEDSGRQKIQVQVERASSFCERTGITPDVVKIDVEGAEAAVLDGLQTLLDRKKVRSLLIEWHPQHLAAAGTTQQQIIGKHFGCRYVSTWGSHRAPEQQEQFTVT